MKITLNKGININEKIVTEIDFNLDKLTGKDLIDAEKEARQLGDQSPTVLLSMTYQASVVAKIIGIPVDDVLALPASDFKNLIVPTASFLLK